MRTDVKIGVTTGLLLVLALVGWQLIFGKTDSPQDANSPGEERVALAPGEDDGTEPPTSPRRELPRFGVVPPSPTSPSPGTREGPVIPSIRETPVTPVIPSIRETPATPPVTPITPVIPSIRETPTTPPITPVTPVIPTIRETPTTPPVTPVTPVIPSIRETPVTPVTPVIPFTPSTPASTIEDTYVVQKGDSGFWAIAAKYYGDGRHWTLIAKANPGVDTNALRPGKKLIMPPKPIARVNLTTTGNPAPGGITVSPTGQRQYVVKKGDSGFWGIAAKHYGNGKYWTLIAKANPDADSGKLKPGDVLILPERSTDTTVGSGNSTPAPTIAPGPGQKIHTVTKADNAGFWGIAKKYYGNGKYYTLIAKANPKVKSGSLKVGQQLIIPELTDEARRTSTSTPARPRTEPRTAPRRSDIEDIGPTPKFN